MIVIRPGVVITRVCGSTCPSYRSLTSISPCYVCADIRAQIRQIVHATDHLKRILHFSRGVPLLTAIRRPVAIFLKQGVAAPHLFDGRQTPPGFEVCTPGPDHAFTCGAANATPNVSRRQSLCAATGGPLQALSARPITVTDDADSAHTRTQPRTHACMHAHILVLVRCDRSKLQTCFMYNNV